MDTVYVFLSRGRFPSLDALRDFVDATYSDDGDELPSAFMQEVELTDYEPSCIEAVVSDAGDVPVKQLLAQASYSDQWLPQLADESSADAAVCVFAPNQVEKPERSSLKYLGAFSYRV